jgi:hypothetical protein
VSGARQGYDVLNLGYFSRREFFGGRAGEHGSPPARGFVLLTSDAWDLVVRVVVRFVVD